MANYATYSSSIDFKLFSDFKLKLFMGNLCKKSKDTQEPSKIIDIEPTRKSIQESNFSSLRELSKNDPQKLSRSDIDIETIRQGYSSPRVFFLF